MLGYLLVGFAIIIFLVLVFLVLSRKKSGKQSLFGDGADIVHHGSASKQRAAFMDDIDTVIENSRKLGEVLVSAGDKGQFYENILLDKELIEKIKQARSKKEIEEILAAWAKENYSRSISPEKSKSVRMHKKNHVHHAVVNKQKAEIVKTKIPAEVGKTENSVVIEKNVSLSKEEQEKMSEARQLYDEIKSLLESKNYEKLLEVIKNLKSERIESLITFYHKNFGDDKFGKVLKNSDGTHNVLVLLKMETIDGLNNELERIKERVAEARRKGCNVQDQTLALLSVPQKIKMFAATFEKKDFLKIRDALLKIETEIDKLMEEKLQEKNLSKS